MSGRPGTGGQSSVPVPGFAAPRGTGPQIGIVAPSYGLANVSYGIPLADYRFHRLRALTARRLFPGNGLVAHLAYLRGQRSDLVHTFNHIPLNRDFVISFEMELPRALGHHGPLSAAIAHRALAGARCRMILPLSQAAEAYFLRRLPAAEQERLAPRLRVFRGMVQPVIPADGLAQDRPLPADRTGPLRLLYVGGDGMRKGLGPVLRAVDRLIGQGADVSLTAIGRLTRQSYVVPGLSVETGDLAAIIAAHPGRITHQQSAGPDAVRQAMLAHDVFVMPTVDDSLGWVFVEAGLSGMPVIATDIFAIPEMVRDGQTGILIPIPKDADGRWAHIGKPGAQAQWAALEERLTQGVVTATAALLDHPERVAAMGQAARERITALYGPARATADLHAIYGAALDRKRP